MRAIVETTARRQVYKFAAKSHWARPVTGAGARAVSYTHLDVYKRQLERRLIQREEALDKKSDTLDRKNEELSLSLIHI